MVKQNRMKQIKLQVGKTYRNRKGEEVRIVKNDGIVEYSYEGSDGEWYTESGKWSYISEEHPKDLIEEVPEPTRHTFAIPEGVKEITVLQKGNCIVVEMQLPEKGPNPGDVMVSDGDSVYIFKEVVDDYTHRHYAWLGHDGHLVIGSRCISGRPATPEEAKLLWDALKKAGKRWNPETMQVEDVPEIYRIREWVDRNLEAGHYNQGNISAAINGYLKYKEATK